MDMDAFQKARDTSFHWEMMHYPLFVDTVASRPPKAFWGEVGFVGPEANFKYSIARYIKNGASVGQPKPLVRSRFLLAGTVLQVYDRRLMLFSLELLYFCRSFKTT
jgi:hypothetical protein